jgi:hypothetical protein
MRADSPFHGTNAKTFADPCGRFSLHGGGFPPPPLNSSDGIGAIEVPGRHCRGFARLAGGASCPEWGSVATLRHGCPTHLVPPPGVSLDGWSEHGQGPPCWVPPASVLAFPIARDALCRVQPLARAGSNAPPGIEPNRCCRRGAPKSQPSQPQPQREPRKATPVPTTPQPSPGRAATPLPPTRRPEPPQATAPSPVAAQPPARLTETPHAPSHGPDTSRS